VLRLEGSMKGSRFWRTAPLLLAMVSPVALAEDTAIVNGTEYHCEHTCEVSTGPYGTYIYDSGGGYIYKTRPKMQ
jgi:hypothetical protein